MCLDTQQWTMEHAWRRLCLDDNELCKFIKPGSMDSDHAWMKVGWRLPPSDFLKLNVDGSYSTDSDQMGWGGAIRDAATKWIMGFQSNSTHSSAFVAEAMALRDGLTIAWNHGSRKLLCESDCKVLVDTLSDSCLLIHHPHTEILHEIHQLLNRQWIVELSRIHRDGNAITNRLARRGYRVINQGILLLNSPPPELEVILLQNMFGVV